jgi:predicted metal-dependent phosphoesterase TrpH
MLRDGVEVEYRPEGGISTFSITDHNDLGGQNRAMGYAAQRSLTYIPGVEMDCTWDGNRYHFLCYGFDCDDPALGQLAVTNGGMYFAEFESCWKLIEPHNMGVTLDVIQERLPERYPTHPSPRLNMWIAQDAFLEKGVFASEAEFQAFWESLLTQNDDGDPLPPFEPFEAVRDVVHAAGGLILLAHVGYYIGPLIGGNRDAQLDTIQRLLADGCDGFELYHPALMAEPHFEELVNEAKRLGCAVSGGSDRHTGVRGVAPDWVAESLQEKLAEASMG